MLKRNVAPLNSEQWNEIDSRAKDVLNTYLSARRVLHVDGPKGWNYTVVEEGRLNEVKEYNNDTRYGLYKVKPLVETRVEFDLDRWEIDNLIRGAKDVNLEPLEEAVKEIALFEENALYNGIEGAGINGLINDSENQVIEFGKDGSSIMDAITDGILRLKKNYVDTPYTLIVGDKAMKLINQKIEGVPLKDRIENLTGTDIVYSHVVDGALLVPYDHEDLEMTIGKDLSIGFQSSDVKTVRLFITESFTHRTLDPSLIINYSL
ncbi:family 1 encapsulin nanocompartment shell protein [Haloplasma contractile]|uniref:Type 1 encapsulin shell protein n=1 Tax=Haloplasma contractile SSD-17B TaxID=1033810 RepID=U2ECL8_9MOLU|nr:family 1 encapsulin nanocompartment shell protein [Haloplasma contractile]ERJ12501.1 Maritimacin protein [Haloplasma contractile SSD-17B]